MWEPLRMAALGDERAQGAKLPFEGERAFAAALDSRPVAGCCVTLLGGTSMQAALVRNVALFAAGVVVLAQEWNVARRRYRMKLRIPVIVSDIDSRFWQKIISWASRHGCFVGVWTLMSGAAGLASTIRGVEVHPASLSVNAMMNEPVVWQIDVTVPDDLEKIDVKAEGLQVQREIKTPAPNRKVFLIEPDTSVVGRVNGSIAVVEKSGATLCTVPMSGEVKPHVRVSPARLFLGSLEYGTASEKIVEKRFRLSSAENWKITRVDVSEIAEAKCEVKDIDAQTKELRLHFPEDTLKVGEPFGAFINKVIRIETNVAAQPEISVPVTAMLSKNGTARNFNTFVFKGNGRWQGNWATPNIAAAVVGPLVLLALGYGAWLLRVNSRYPVLIQGTGVVLCLAALAAMFFLVKTYSRGGWAAFGFGLVSLIWLMKGRRRILAAGAAAFVLIVIALPAGMQRAASAAAVAEDGSIRNRLLVWRGALEMIADYPLQGVGVARFGESFQNFYQEPWHKPSYSTAINDYLTFAAERGLVGVLLTVSVGVFLMAFSVQMVRRHADYWLVPILSVSCMLAIASLFSTIEFVREVRILAFSSAAILATYCALRPVYSVRRGRKSERDNTFRGILARSVATTVMTAGIVGWVVVWADMTRLVHHSLSTTSATGSVIEYRPGRIPPRGTVIFLPQQPEPLTVTGRKILRPLAQNGWRAITLNVPSYDQEATRVVADLLRDIPGPLIVLAEKAKARVALGAVQNMPQGHRPRLALIAPVLFSALSECDRSHQADDLMRHLALVDVRHWEAFKQGERRLVGEFSETINRLLVAAEPVTPREHLALLPRFQKLDFSSPLTK